MRKRTKNVSSMHTIRWLLAICSIILLCGLSAYGQSQRTITGQVVDEQGVPMPGVTVVLKDNPSVGTGTNLSGEFSLSVPASEQFIVASFVGMETQEVSIVGMEQVQVVLRESAIMLEDVVMVGYGKQRKESVVGAISQTSGEALERTGGVSNIGAALTGQIPGMITMQGTGKPGDEQPIIYLRGQGTWNFGNPLVLVDGVERDMSDIDFRSVESISVLKDASATAVFGVKGANGVILITTKRGAEGDAVIRVSSSMTTKVPSRLPNKYNAYDALRVQNMAIEREVNINPNLFGSYNPIQELEKYRNPSSQEEADLYPDVDWQKESFKSHAMAYNTNVSISGGTPFVKYFTSMDYQHEGDLMNTRDVGQGYSPGYGYDRLNFRSNLDFNLTKTTVFSANLAGIYAHQKETWSGFEYRMWQAAYRNPPSAFPVQYSDGTWGFWSANPIDVMNSVQIASTSGVKDNKRSIINTDFSLDQDLSAILDGLSARGTFALDNTFRSEGGVWPGWDGPLQMWVNPETRDTVYNQIYGSNMYDYIDPQPLWEIRPDEMQNDDTERKMYYQLMLNYERQFNRHNVTAMGLFSRDQRAKGSIFPLYREDWVFRTTYNYDLRYFLELNGAYNGSEKFGAEYRFDFFPSLALGWTLTNENFMSNVTWLNLFKVRGSYGMVGNDRIHWDEYNADYRWLYQTQWEYGGNSLLGRDYSASSPYSWYREGVIGNPFVQWEVVEKKNVGVDYSLFYGLIQGSVDVFEDYTSKILIRGDDRAMMDYLGATAPAANLGEVRVRGYEIETRINYIFPNRLRVWGNMVMTNAKDIVLFADDPLLAPSYQKKEGYQIDQYRSQMIGDFMNTWDEVYASTEWEVNDHRKLPGEYNIIDFNADGRIDSFDDAPNGFPERPQKTYNWTLGTDYRGIGFFVQFYGVKNVTRVVGFNNFTRQLNVVYDQGEYWSKDNPNADSFVPRYVETFNRYGNYYAYDGSFLRLKNAEISYTFSRNRLNIAGMESLKVFLSGNNLLLWTKMPDDRESNLGESGAQGHYPTMRRITLGLNIVL